MLTVLMLNWFQTLIWVYVMDPLIQFRVVSGWVRPGQRASLSQSSQRDIFIHAHSDSHMAKFRPANLTCVSLGCGGSRGATRDPTQTRPARPVEGFEPWTSVAVRQVTCMKWLLGFLKPTIFENITKFVFTTLNCCIAAEIAVVDI